MLGFELDWIVRQKIELMVVERAEETFYTDSWQSQAFNKYFISWKIVVYQM